jgi:hypothetical protein
MRPIGIRIAIFGAAIAFLPAASAQTSAADAEAQAQAARQNAIADRYLTEVPLEMSGRIDTKTAVAGQEVSAKTLAEVRLADGTALPKGTRLVGRVVQARAGGQEQGSAILTLTFDRAEVKGGQSIAVRCVIRAVGENAASAQTRRDLMDPSVDAGSAAGAGATGADMPGTARPTVGGRAGAGATIPDASPGTAPSAGSGPVSRRQARETDSLGAPAQPADRKVADAGESVTGAPRAPGLPGVLLWSAPMASGTLTALGANFTLENGTRMTLGVITR